MLTMLNVQQYLTISNNLLVGWKDITDEEAKMLSYILDQLTPVRTIIDDK